ncbi:copper chaperone PCu(A)C [Lichenifustis flavocetrariae]|uniref:Copper chaperone PCu(A)C n=1 Tax=Lichenifustis flavocetrariae TaxID=2949735 RepID=A0AA41YR23_9HYPH|nr:copper chaperone PCu(A)C [Lichenifustis flavocetrariae]MCW6506579.1 copper chaperone PCu(A)C [Lichenifustis flavocetrariae]
MAGLAMLVLAPTLATAQDFAAGTLVIEHPWARATPGGAQIGGGYLTVENKGGAPDRLIGGSFEASSGFELHEMSMDAGVMRMRPTGPLEIPAGGKLTLDPSAKHIMFTGLKRALKKGETVAGTLVFEHAGTVPVSFEVEGIGARGPAKAGSAGHTGHPMPGMDMD